MKLTIIRLRRDIFLVSLLVFLACMMPRYIGVFKVKIGINFSLYDIAVLLVWVLYAKKQVLVKRYEVIFFIIWLIWTVASFWRANAVNLWAYYVLYLGITILFLQYMTRIHDASIFEAIPKVLSAALFVHLLIGLYEITSHRYLFEVGSFSKRYYGKVGVSIFHNPNDYSTFVIVILPFIVYLLAHEKLLVKKIWYCLLVALSIPMLIINESRLAVLSLFVLGNMYMLVLTRRSKYRILYHLLFLMTLAGAFSFSKSRVWLMNMLHENSLNLSKNSDQIRLNLIKNGFYFLRKTYGFGVGAGNLHEWLTTKSIYYIGDIRYMHNWYIEILVTFGVVIFTLYLIWHIRVMRNLIHNSTTEKNILGIHTGYLLSFICFTLMSVSSSTNVYSEWVWMYLTVLSGYTVYSLSSQKQGKQTYTL